MSQIEEDLAVAKRRADAICKGVMDAQWYLTRDVTAALDRLQYARDECQRLDDRLNDLRIEIEKANA